MNGPAENRKTSGCVPSAKAPIGIEKECIRCKKVKPVLGFRKDRSRHDGLHPWCKECGREAYRKWARTNPKKCRETKIKWQKANPEKCRERARRWREVNREKRLEDAKEYQRKRRSTPNGRLNDSMGKAIRYALKSEKAGRSWESLVGYSVHDLVKHLEKQFTEGMSWEKLIRGEIHIDHIIPISVFNFKTPDDIDFKKCWALKNLQPLWANENFSKNARLDKPFQPSFAFGV